jgi:hypothetical protein
MFAHIYRGSRSLFLEDERRRRVLAGRLRRLMVLLKIDLDMYDRSLIRKCLAIVG